MFDQPGEGDESKEQGNDTQSVPYPYEDEDEYEPSRNIAVKSPDDDDEPDTDSDQPDRPGLHDRVLDAVTESVRGTLEAFGV